MRTTLDIADDVLQGARERARRENTTAGEVASELLRQALTASTPGAVREPRRVHGLTPFVRLDADHRARLRPHHLLPVVPLRAVHRGGRLVTFDVATPASADVDAKPGHLLTR